MAWRETNAYPCYQILSLIGLLLSVVVFGSDYDPFPLWFYSLVFDSIILFPDIQIVMFATTNIVVVSLVKNYRNKFVEDAGKPNKEAYCTTVAYCCIDDSPFATGNNAPSLGTQPMRARG